MIIITILVIILLYFISLHFKNTRIAKKLSKQFPLVPHKPIIGNTLLFKDAKNMSEIFHVMMKFNKKYGRNCLSVSLFGAVNLLASDPKTVEQILQNKTVKKSLIYNFMEPWVGQGILTSYGSRWFQKRKLSTPGFHFKILEQFTVVFNLQTNKFVEKIRKNVGNADFNVYDDITMMALDIICETAMGVKINAQDNPDQEYVKAVKRQSVIIFKRIFSLLREFSFVFELSSLAWEQRKLLKILHKFTDDVIKTRKEQLLLEKNKDENEDDAYGKKKMTLMDLLLSVTVDGKPLSNNDIREDIDTFMFAGHDTTTSGLSFCLHHISHHEKIQEKMYEEIVRVLGDDPKNVELTYALLHELKYMEMVIKETLRVHPSVPIIGRKMVEDTVIDGVTIPKGIDVVIPIYAMHHNEEIFPNPEVFDPERFSDENSAKRGPYDYIPFSAGGRNCIGQKYAMLEMKTTLVKLLANYKVLPSQKKLECQADLVLRPVDGIFIKIVDRNN